MFKHRSSALKTNDINWQKSAYSDVLSKTDVFRLVTDGGTSLFIRIVVFIFPRDFRWFFVFTYTSLTAGYTFLVL